MLNLTPTTNPLERRSERKPTGVFTIRQQHFPNYNYWHHICIDLHSLTSSTYTILDYVLHLHAGAICTQKCTIRTRHECRFSFFVLIRTLVSTNMTHETKSYATNIVNFVIYLQSKYSTTSILIINLKLAKCQVVSK